MAGKEEAGVQTGIFQSGQMGQTVNLLVFTFGGSNPSVPTTRRIRNKQKQKDNAVIAQW